MEEKDCNIRTLKPFWLASTQSNRCQVASPNILAKLQFLVVQHPFDDHIITINHDTSKRSLSLSLLISPKVEAVQNSSKYSYSSVRCFMIFPRHRIQINESLRLVLLLWFHHHGGGLRPLGRGRGSHERRGQRQPWRRRLRMGMVLRVLRRSRPGMESLVPSGSGVENEVELLQTSYKYI